MGKPTINGHFQVAMLVITRGYRSCWASHLLQAVQRFRGYPATESHARHSGWSQEPGYIHRDGWTWCVWKNLVAQKIDGWSVDHCFPMVFPCFPVVFPWFPLVSRCSPIFRPVRAWRFGGTAPVSVSGRWSQRWRATDIWRDLVKELKPLKEFDPHVGLALQKRKRKVGPWCTNGGTKGGTNGGTKGGTVPWHIMAWWRSGVAGCHELRAFCAPMITGFYMCSAAVFSEIHEGLNKRQLRISHGWPCHVGSQDTRPSHDQASLPQPQNRKPIKTAPCTLCKPDVFWNQNDKFIAGPWAKLMSWRFFGSNPWDLSNTSPIFFSSPDAIHWDAMDCTAAPQVIEPLEMTTQIVLSRHIFTLGSWNILELCWLCYTASRVNFFWIPLSDVVGPTPWAWYLGHDLWGTWRNRWTSHPSIPDGCHKASQTQLSSTVTGSARFISKRPGIWDPWCVWDWDGFTSLYHIISCLQHTDTYVIIYIQYYTDIYRLCVQHHVWIWPSNCPLAFHSSPLGAFWNNLRPASWSWDNIHGPRDAFAFVNCADGMLTGYRLIPKIVLFQCVACGSQYSVGYMLLYNIILYNIILYYIILYYIILYIYRELYRYIDMKTT